MRNPYPDFAHVIDSNGHPLCVSQPYHNASLSSTPLLVHTGPCYIRWMDAYNPDSGNRAFIKFFDSVDEPVLGVDLPVKTVFLPTDGDNPQHFVDGFPVANSLWVACTGALADLDTSAPSTAVLLDLGYSY